VKFNSLEFIFLFLPITVIVFYSLEKTNNKKILLSWLVGASLFFYGYWNPAYLLLICTSIAINFFIGRQISRSRGKAKRRLLLSLGISFNLALLGYFKYANFFVGTVSGISGADLQLATIALPLAISFFTFQQIAFLADASRHDAKEYDFLNYCLFVTFFPQLIAGPIVHHREMMPQFEDKARLNIRTADVAVGLTIFIIGLAKKTLIADSLAVYADPVFAAAENGGHVSMVEAWGGVLSYTFQIYFDFSGYSDMAIGLAKIFGINLPLNFFSPYRSRDIGEFWRRWHITLGRFLKEYLYIPLGGNRHGLARTAFSLSATMLLGGLWHGAAWTFVIWGGLHGAYLLAHRIWRRVVPQSQSTGRLIFGWALTFLCVSVAWVFFRADSIDGARLLLQSMAGMHGVVLPETYMRFVTPFIELFDRLGLQWGTLPLYGGRDQLALLAMAAVIAFFLPNTFQIMTPQATDAPIRAGIRAVAAAAKLSWQPRLATAILVGCLGAFAVAAISRTSPFIYFNF